MMINPMMSIPLLLLICLGLAIFVLAKIPGALGKIFNIIGIIALFITGLRPVMMGEDAANYENDIDIIVVIDNTFSMRAEDYPRTTRREVAAGIVEKIIARYAGSRIGVISFENMSHALVPLTTDADSAIVAIRTLRDIESYTAQGSNVTMFKDDLEMMLKSAKKKSDRHQLVFVLSDGENTSDDGWNDLSGLASMVEGGIVFGLGTTAGGRMSDGFSEDSYIQDYSTYPISDALSKIDESNLKKIAKQLGIQYYYVKDKNSSVDMVNNMKINYKPSSDNMSEYLTDYYYYFSSIIIVVAIINLIIYKKAGAV